ncbi:DnaB-like helicase N-terminal domain-containing protein [Micromonospora carbonacea]|uniref:DnaB-like helicase N-terminal domain-containing protein n=1 Tax=Micromonospora carbonacea TaxID=47853 RepID=UPI000ABD3007|nr:DnaB-like helicase N-terminal domain-containing protein [Micromonospora carbonacea]
MTRPPAHDHAAEQAVIGAALLNPSVVADLAPTLAPADFHRPAHGRLWETLRAMHAAGEPVDPIALAARLAATGDLAKVGGAPYLHTLTRVTRWSKWPQWQKPQPCGVSAIAAI